MDEEFFSMVRAFIVNIMQNRLRVDNFGWHPAPIGRGLPVQVPGGSMIAVRRCVEYLIVQARMRIDIVPERNVYLTSGFYTSHLSIGTKIAKLFSVGIPLCNLSNTWISVIRLICWTCCIASWVRFDPSYFEVLAQLADLFVGSLSAHAEWFQNNDIWGELEITADEIWHRAIPVPMLSPADEIVLETVERFERILRDLFRST